MNVLHRPPVESGSERVTRLRHVLVAMRGDKLALFALLIFAFYCLVALLAPLLAPYDVNSTEFMNLENAELAPAWQTGDTRFLLGTDTQGRDLLSVILHGTHGPSKDRPFRYP